jgi:hypothetical protein
MGNLTCDGDQDVPLPSFRTDSWDFPESDDPAVDPKELPKGYDRKWDPEARLEYRRTEEAKRAVEVLERIKALGRNQ